MHAAVRRKFHDIIKLKPSTIAEEALSRIDRKNCVFADSDKGGERITDIPTIIETAKQNGLNPEVYLTDVLSRILDHPTYRLEELLPWQGRRQKTCARLPDGPLEDYLHA